jgi:zinc protease
LNLILTEGKTSRLYQRLVEREQSVTFISADYGESRDPTLFHFRAEARGEHTAEEIEASLYEEMKSIVSEGVTQRELDRAKHQVEAHFVLSRERAQDQAMLFGQIESLHGTGYIDTYLEKISATTSADVMSVCSRYFTEKNRTVGYLVSDGSAATEEDSDEVSDEDV